MAYKDKATGGWVAQWYEVDVDGKNKQHKKWGFKTQRDAKKYEHERNLKSEGNLDMTVVVKQNCCTWDRLIPSCVLLRTGSALRYMNVV